MKDGKEEPTRAGGDGALGCVGHGPRETGDVPSRARQGGSCRDILGRHK